MWGYYQRLLWMAFRHSWSLAGSVVGVISVIAAVISFVVWRVEDNIVSQTVSLITAVIFILLFLGRLVFAPYWTHLEDEAKRQAERSEEEKKRADLEAELNRRGALLDSRSVDRRKREEQMSCLAELLKEGDRLKNENVNSPDRMNEWMLCYQEWRGRLDSEVREKFTTADAARLSTLPKVIEEYSYPFCNGIHQDALAHISAIVQEMHAMSRDLSAKD